MDTLTIKQEIHDYIDTASDEQIESLYATIKNGNNPAYQWWEDDELVAELEQISADMDSGKEKSTPWEEVKKNLLNELKKNEI
jgi:hypothetical protein